MNKIIYSLKYFSLTMDIKYEIKVHDGPGRLNRILLNNGIKKTLESPLLASPQSIPPFHKSEFNKETLQPLEKQNDLIIGYLPPLHTFSTYDSTSLMNSA